MHTCSAQAGVGPLAQGSSRTLQPVHAHPSPLGAGVQRKQCALVRSTRRLLPSRTAPVDDGVLLWCVQTLSGAAGTQAKSRAASRGRSAQGEVGKYRVLVMAPDERVRGKKP